MEDTLDMSHIFTRRVVYKAIRDNNLEVILFPHIDVIVIEADEAHDYGDEYYYGMN